jgi:hypothetical protein
MFILFNGFELGLAGGFTPEYGSSAGYVVQNDATLLLFQTHH